MYLNSIKITFIFYYVNVCVSNIRTTPLTKTLNHGNSYQASTFIVGGSEAIPHEFPWQVSIRDTLGAFHLCGGVIIDAYTVLTTARCAERGTVYVTSVAAGKHNLSITQEPESQIVLVSSIHTHPQFPGNSDYSNDIAVLKVNTAFQWTESVSPLNNFQLEYHIPGEFAIITGWGTKREEEISLQQTLQKATVKIIDNNECQSFIGSTVQVEDSMVCISSPNSNETVDSCTGDEGGPLIATNYNESPVLIGLVSFGIGCGRPNLPSFCTRISPYIEFIQLYQESSKM